MKPWQEIMSLKSTKGLILIVVGLLFLGLPLFASQYVSYLMLTFFAYATMVLGLNLLFGYTGLLSFGHAFFMAIGAYTAEAVLQPLCGVDLSQIPFYGFADGPVLGIPCLIARTGYTGEDGFELFFDP